MTPDRLHESLRWLEAEFSVTPDEFRSEHKAGGDMLLTALLSLDYAKQANGRVAVSEQGRRRLRALEVPEVEEA